MTPKKSLLRHLDGNLSSEEARALKAQLAQDADLQGEFAYLKRIRAQIARRPPNRSPGLWADIEARLQADGLINPLWDQLVWVGKRLMPLLAVAAVVLLTVLGNISFETTTATIDDYFASQTATVLSTVDVNTILPLSESSE